MALDNSVLGDVTAECIPEGKMEDKEAVKQLIELARQGKIELGIALTGASIEARAAGETIGDGLQEQMSDVLHVWPVVVPSDLFVEMQRKKKCLEKIMQDRGGIDSGIFLVSTLHAQYFLTTDYRYHRQFRNQGHRIRKECGITAQVLTPSEFLNKYSNGAVS